VANSNANNQELTSPANQGIKVAITEDARDFILKSDRAITMEVETNYV